MEGNLRIVKGSGGCTVSLYALHSEHIFPLYYTRYISTILFFFFVFSFNFFFLQFHNSDCLSNWLLRFIASNYLIFSQKPEFEDLSGNCSICFLNKTDCIPKNLSWE